MVTVGHADFLRAGIIDGNSEVFAYFHLGFAQVQAAGSWFYGKETGREVSSVTVGAHAAQPHVFAGL